MSDVLKTISYEYLFSLAKLVLHKETQETTTEVHDGVDPTGEIFGPNSPVVWTLIGVSAACVGGLFCVLLIMGTGLTYYNWNNKRKRQE